MAKETADNRVEEAWKLHRLSQLNLLLGLDIEELQPGLCTMRMPIRRAVLNQIDTVHGGIYGVVADHTAGMAAQAAVPADRRVLTIEYKISILRPGDVVELRSEGRVTKEGKRIVFGEATIDGIKADGTWILLCKALATFAVVPAASLEKRP